MKRVLQIAIIALFVAALWVPLLCTPFRFQQEREGLRFAERRAPSGALSLQAYDGNIEPWVEGIQSWYSDSFAFRTRSLNAYNAVNYFIRNYPGEIFGADGQLLTKKGIVEGLSQLTDSQEEQIQKNLKGLRRICEDAGIPCIFIIIPSALTVHPEFAPNWVDVSRFVRHRDELAETLRAAKFPVFDLSDGVKAYAEETGSRLFLKYDFHWNTLGAMEGYRQIMKVLNPYCPEARTVSEARVEVSEKKDVTQFTRRRYLDFMLSETGRGIEKIDLPPVRVVSSKGEKSTGVYWVARAGVTEVFCPELGEQTVLFIRDSFLSTPSQLLNHSLPHSVYMNFSKEGRDPRAAIERYQPDLLVFALQESRVKRALMNLDCFGRNR